MTNGSFVAADAADAADTSMRQRLQKASKDVPEIQIIMIESGWAILT